MERQSPCLGLHLRENEGAEMIDKCMRCGKPLYAEGCGGYCAVCVPDIVDEYDRLADENADLKGRLETIGQSAEEAEKKRIALAYAGSKTWHKCNTALHEARQRLHECAYEQTRKSEERQPERG